MGRGRGQDAAVRPLPSLCPQAMWLPWLCASCALPQGGFPGLQIQPRPVSLAVLARLRIALSGTAGNLHGQEQYASKYQVPGRKQKGRLRTACLACQLLAGLDSDWERPARLFRCPGGQVCLPTTLQRLRAPQIHGCLSPAAGRRLPREPLDSAMHPGGLFGAPPVRRQAATASPSLVPTSICCWGVPRESADLGSGPVIPRQPVTRNTCLPLSLSKR